MDLTIAGDDRTAIELLEENLPLAEASDDPGRNSACWCGSSKKYKRCCGDSRRI
jgi:uncharacterized protein YecA (UPF0149 family)